MGTDSALAGRRRLAHRPGAGGLGPSLRITSPANIFTEMRFDCQVRFEAPAYVCYTSDVTTTPDMARKAARSRWRGTTAEQRSQAMSAIRRQGWARMPAQERRRIAVERGRRGAAARWRGTTPEERRRIARKFAATRKANKIKALAEAPI